MTNRQSEHGFTIVELLVVTIVIGILSLTIANFITTWLQASSLAQTRSDLLTNAENALDTVTKDIQLSGSVDQNNRWPDNNASGGLYGWSSDNQTLVLAEVAVDSSNNILYSDPSKYITLKDNEIYFVSGKTLYRRTLASGSAGDIAVTTCPASGASPSCPADKVVATGVTSWSVTYYDANDTVVSPTEARSIQLAITLAGVLNTQTITANYTTRMVFRND